MVVQVGLAGSGSARSIVGILRGTINASWKSQSFDRPKIPRSHHPPSVVQKYEVLFQMYFLFSRMYLCFMNFRISKIYQDSTIANFRFYLKRPEIPIVFGPPENNGFQNSEVPHSQKF